MFWSEVRFILLKYQRCLYFIVEGCLIGIRVALKDSEFERYGYLGLICRCVFKYDLSATLFGKETMGLSP